MTAFSADHAGATVVPSPNAGERIGFERPDMLLLHYTGMPSEDGALAWLASEESQVSSHYFVRENGEIIQMVPEFLLRLACRQEHVEGLCGHQFRFHRRRNRQCRSSGWFAGFP